MKIKGILNVGRIVVILGISIGIYQCGLTVFGSRNFYFCLDPLLAPEMRTALKAIVQQSVQGSLPSIAAAMQEVCPFCESITLHRLSSGTLIVNGKIVKPYVCLADQAVMMANGVMAERSHFSAAALAHVPVIAGATLPNQSALFKQWLLSIDKSIFDEYAITWVDDYEIYLRHKKGLEKAIVCTVMNSIDEKIRKKCQEIFCIKANEVSGTASHSIIADIRFEKQIIVCSHKGGAGYG